MIFELLHKSKNVKLTELIKVDKIKKNFTGQILSYRIPILEKLMEDLKDIEDSIDQPYIYFKVLILLINNFYTRNFRF